LYACDTLLERLAQHLEDVTAELRQLIQKEHAIMRQRYLPWHRHLAAADQPHIGDGVMGGPKGPDRDQRRARAGEAGDAMHAGGLEGFGQAHRRQDGGEPAR
jgi:hypothetical protein